ncbi:L,D-transpeptidase family protein [Streptomyces sp. HNM0574]|uniref:L,D-transpeptidase family protein n=1 Tax=Streptomyces sp. HNM0574 TaxID=2714954 RepID=UPI001F10690C|nr:L,D-transpeptidase family protein [Streptomyces sp. HNM0574]
MRVLALAAALTVGAGALAGCKAETGDGALVRVSKLPEAPAATEPGPGPEEPVRSRLPEAPVAQSPVGSKRPVTPRPSRTAPPADRVVLKPGAEGRDVRELQARLQQLKLFALNPTGYYGKVTAASVRLFQEKRGEKRTGTVTARLRTALEARTHEPTRAELYPPTLRPLDDPDPRCRTGRALCISKTSRTLAWMVDGKVREAMDVRFGSAYTPTREGRFKVDFKSRHHHSTLYDTPMPYAMFFSRGQAVHYSADFKATGYSGASHGCVNVRDKKALAAVFAQVKKGDKVIVYK